MDSTTRLGVALVAPAVLLIVVLYNLPLLRILGLSVTEAPGFVENYRQLFVSDVIHRVLLATIRICTLTTVITLVVAYATAAALTLASERARRVMIVLVLLPLWLSVLVRAFAWVTILRGNGVLNSALLSAGVVDAPLQLVRNEIGVVIGMVHYMLPFAIFPLWASMKSIDPRLFQAARAFGASPVTIFRRVFFPLSLPGLYSALLITLVFSLGFYVTPAILGGGRVLMVAEYVRVLVHESIEWGTATMLATMLLLTVVAALATLGRVADLGSMLGQRTR
ncbi:ABC transporter permease [Enterovirga sp. CN4-39]